MITKKVKGIFLNLKDIINDHKNIIYTIMRIILLLIISLILYKRIIVEHLSYNIRFISTEF